MNRFWVVWNPNGRMPVVKHLNDLEAINEARRLARMNPGQGFYVLEARACYLAEEIPVREIFLSKEEPCPSKRS